LRGAPKSVNSKLVISAGSVRKLYQSVQWD